MSATGNFHRNRDTVEEFWDKGTLRKCKASAAQSTTENFLKHLGRELNALGKIVPTSSGRAALREALEKTKSDAEKRSVLLCSFNCGAVCKAVMDAGFVPETFDFCDHSGRIDWGDVARRLRVDHHALIVTHFFGVPCDFRAAQEMAAALNVLIIEDCAHTLGGKIANATAGTVGDLSIFSFNYDKPVSLGGGGAILINSRRLQDLFHAEDYHISVQAEAEELDRFVRYLRDRRNGIRSPGRLRRLIRLATGQCSTNEEFVPPNGIGPFRAALGIWQLNNFQEIRKLRNGNAAAFVNNPAWHSWYVGPSVDPAWLKQKIIPISPHDVDRLASRLQWHGLRVGRFNWPETIDRILRTEERPNARYISDYGLDVPIHQRMRLKDLDLVLAIVGESF